MIDISTGQALLLGLIGGIGLITWIYSFMQINRALVMAGLTGAVLGHAEQALMFGAAAELLYLGLINAAGVVPPNALGPGIFGVVILLTSKNMDIGTAITLSMPFAIFTQFIITLIFTLNSPLGGVMERLIQKEKFTLYRIAGHATGILLFILGFVLGLGAGLGYEAFGKAIDKIPFWLQKGLGKGGGLLPAMGFAVVLRLMLKREYTPFVLMGFSLYVIFHGVAAAMPNWGFSLIAIAITATAVALIVFYSGLLQKSNITTKQKTVTEGGSDGI